VPNTLTTLRASDFIVLVACAALGAAAHAEEPKGEAELSAKLFLASLLTEDFAAAGELSALPFFLENQKIDTHSALLEAWRRELRGKRVDLLEVKGLEVLTFEEMQAKHGKPPARLGRWPYQTGKTKIAVANVSGRAAVLLLRQVGGKWKVVAFHD
jgi:hypothetical protein